MSTKYGFGGGIDLPKAPAPRPAAPRSAIDDAVKAGHDLGFVNREPTPKRKPGPKQKEPQDKVSIPGPKRVIDQFRAYCADENITLWEGLERLMQGK